MQITIRRGEIYFLFLDPVFGREEGGFKSRPAVVLSTEKIHEGRGVAIVIPATSKLIKPFPNVVEVKGDNQNGLAGEPHTFFLCHQIRAVDIARLQGKPKGVLAPSDMRRIEKSVKYCLAFDLGLSP